MKEKTIQIESVTYQYLLQDEKWQVKLPKSQTCVKDIRQMALINKESDLFVPSFVEEGEELFTFSFIVDPQAKTWEDVRKLDRNDKLRLLCNLARFKTCLSTRMTFFLHPDNLIVDDNLIPSIVYRGIRDLVPPYHFDEEKFTLQYKCLIIAVFSNKYSFDELYAGSLTNAADTEFERQVNEMNDLDALIKLVNDHYLKEKIESEKKLQVVPKKQFRLFKRLTFAMIALSVLLAIPLAYLAFAKIPFQRHLLEADRYFISTDYANVINELEAQNPEKLPDASKYVLASSYIYSEFRNERVRDDILKNVSLKSDPNYLLYWIYNGRGDFGRAIDLAKFIDDPRLIMYGLSKQIEKAKKDPTLSGTERENKVQKYEEQLEKYKEKYGIDSLSTPESDGAQPANQMEEPTSQEVMGQENKQKPEEKKEAEKTNSKSNEKKDTHENKK